VIGHSVYS